MTGECYYCHGIVLPDEPGDVVLDGHGDHQVYLHLKCAAGQKVVEETAGGGGGLTVTCPECGETESR